MIEERGGRGAHELNRLGTGTPLRPSPPPPRRRPDSSCILRAVPLCPMLTQLMLARRGLNSGKESMSMPSNSPLPVLPRYQGVFAATRVPSGGCRGLFCVPPAS